MLCVASECAMEGSEQAALDFLDLWLCSKVSKVPKKKTWTFWTCGCVVKYLRCWVANGSTQWTSKSGLFKSGLFGLVVL